MVVAAEPALALAEPMMFIGDTWVCDTPEHYDSALSRQREGGDQRALRRELRDAGQCIFVQEEDEEDILPPFITVEEEHDGKSKVAFFIRSEQRVALLNRRIAHTRYVGWTESKRLQSREEWRKLGG
jgi:hypothetical protein